MRKVTIEDISQRTGLSRGTISRALNNRPDISEKTKQRVLDACRELNYVPNHTARSLATGRNLACAVVVDDLSRSFCAAYLRGVIRAAEEVNYSIQVVELGGDPAAARERVRMLAAYRIDGVLMGCALTPELATELRGAQGARVTGACHPLDGVPADVISPDYAEAGRLLGRLLLISRRCASPLYLHNPRTEGAGDLLDGFQQVCREHGAAPEAVTVAVGGGAETPVERERLQRADGIACSDDCVAVRAAAACLSIGRMPGRDVTIVGVGNERFTECVDPPLATIDLNGEEIGRRAFQFAFQRLSHERMDGPQHIRVAPDLISRATICAAPDSQPDPVL